MKQHRHFGQYIAKSIKSLKKNQSDYRDEQWCWDKLDPDYDVYVTIRLKKKRPKKT